MSDRPAEALTLAPGELQLRLILRRMGKIFRANFLKFFAIALLAVVPDAFGTVSGGIHVNSLFGMPITSQVTRQLLGAVPFAIGSVLFKTITEAATLYGAFQTMRGREFRLGQSFARGLARLLPLLGLWFVSSLAIGLGFVMLIVPGLMVLARFYVAVPVCVMEGLGPVQSLKRSAELTKGQRWKVLGASLYFILLSVVVGNVTKGTMLTTTIGPIATQLLGLTFGAIIDAYSSITVAVIYSDLRGFMDGADIDRIAAVFD